MDYILEAVASRYGLPLIEDACLVQGGRVAGSRPAGSFGIASVVSFGAGKPISLDHGGAILTDDPALYKTLHDMEEKLPPFSFVAQEGIDSIGRSHTRLYNNHYGRDLEQNLLPFQSMALAGRHCFLHRFDNAVLPKLTQAVENLEEEIDRRWANWERMNKVLQERFREQLEILIPTPGAVPWRFNILMHKEKRNAVMQAIHRAGHNASSWHPPVSQFLEVQSPMGGAPIAHTIGEQILNLWITDYFDEYEDVVIRALKQWEAEL